MSRLHRVVHEHIGDAIIALGAAAVLLTIEVVRRRAGLDGGADVDAVKTTLDTASKVLGLVLGVVGAIAGYRRFFKGRTFAERMELALSCRPVRWTTSAEGQRVLLHAVDVGMKNAGSTTIWEPEVLLRVRRLDSDAAVDLDPGVRSEGIEAAPGRGDVTGIEPGESVVSHHRFLVPGEVSAFRLSAEVRSAKGSVRRHADTVVDCFDPKREESG